MTLHALTSILFVGCVIAAPFPQATTDTATAAVSRTGSALASGSTSASPSRVSGASSSSRGSQTRTHAMSYSLPPLPTGVYTGPVKPDKGNWVYAVAMPILGVVLIGSAVYWWHKQHKRGPSRHQRQMAQIREDRAVQLAALDTARRGGTNPSNPPGAVAVTRPDDEPASPSLPKYTASTPHGEQSVLQAPPPAYLPVPRASYDTESIVSDANSRDSLVETHEYARETSRSTSPFVPAATRDDDGSGAERGV